MNNLLLLASFLPFTHSREDPRPPAWILKHQTVPVDVRPEATFAAGIDLERCIWR